MTSQSAREYWVKKAKELMEPRLTHPDYGGSPQLDEFNQVMDDLIRDSQILSELMTEAKKILGDKLKQELGQCPHCNGKVAVEIDAEQWPEIWCQDCNFVWSTRDLGYFKHDSIENTIIRHWNERPVEDKIREMIEEAKRRMTYG